MDEPWRRYFDNLEEMNHFFDDNKEPAEYFMEGGKPGGLQARASKYKYDYLDSEEEPANFGLTPFLLWAREEFRASRLSIRKKIKDRSQIEKDKWLAHWLKEGAIHY
jgi:hypothetical protein